jgi:hypothetical protein
VLYKEIKKYQKKEKVLSAALISVATLAPITFTYLMERKIHWLFSLSIAFSVLLLSLWILFYRSSISRKLKVKYESLERGLVLSKRSRQQQRFIITNAGYSHYYLKSLETGEQLLVSRERAQEDFILSASE